MPRLYATLSSVAKAMDTEIETVFVRQVRGNGIPYRFVVQFMRTGRVVEEVAVDIPQSTIEHSDDVGALERAIITRFMVALQARVGHRDPIVLPPGRPDPDIVHTGEIAEAAWCADVLKLGRAEDQNPGPPPVRPFLQRDTLYINGTTMVVEWDPPPG